MLSKEQRVKLRQLAKEGSERAHSPYSNAKIGSAIITKDGKFFNGCNIENSSYGGTVCAERVTIWKAVSEGSKDIEAIYIYSKDGWPPCGLCRQVMSEFCGHDLIVIIGDGEGKESDYTLGDILPLAFTPDHLL